MDSAGDKVFVISLSRVRRNNYLSLADCSNVSRHVSTVK